MHGRCQFLTLDPQTVPEQALCAALQQVSGRVTCFQFFTQGQLNVFGRANTSLIPELAVPPDKLALFQTACFNPTIPGASRRRSLPQNTPHTAHGVIDHVRLLVAKLVGHLL